MHILLCPVSLVVLGTLPWPWNRSCVHFVGFAVLTSGLRHHDGAREDGFVGMQQEAACAKNLFPHLLQGWLILFALSLYLSGPTIPWNCSQNALV